MTCYVSPRETLLTHIYAPVIFLSSSLAFNFVMNGYCMRKTVLFFIAFIININVLTRLIFKDTFVVTVLLNHSERFVIVIL